jgi:transposase InsO family protein
MAATWRNLFRRYSSAPAISGASQLLVHFLHNAECLNVHWFMTLGDAREKLECWRRDYNEVRPHGALGNKAPISLLIPAGDTNPPVAKQLENSSSE